MPEFIDPMDHLSDDEFIKLFYEHDFPFWKIKEKFKNIYPKKRRRWMKRDFILSVYRPILRTFRKKNKG